MSYEPTYHRTERCWYLWNPANSEAVHDERGELRLFITAAEAYEWLSEHVDDETATRSKPF